MINGEGTVLISVIVPVYKVEYDLLRKCLGSLSSQAHSSVEFIVVDDGSPDDCGSICDEFAMRCPSMRVIHIDNAGVSHARNVGLDNSRGSYVLFVDGDDQLPEGFLDHLRKNISVLSDITFFNHRVGQASNKMSNLDSWVVGASLSPRELTKAVLTFRLMPSGMSRIKVGAPWGKVFRKDFILQHDCRFPEGVRKTQDRIFVVEALSYEPKCTYIPVDSYIYIKNSGSITKRYNPQALNLVMETRDAMHGVLATRYVDDDEVNSWFATFVAAIMLETVIDLDILHRDNPCGVFGKYKKFKMTVSALMPDVKNAEPGNASSGRAKVVTGMMRGGHFLIAFISLFVYAGLKSSRNGGV